MNSLKKLLLMIFAVVGLTQVSSSQALFGRRYYRGYARPYYDRYYDDGPYYTRGEAIADATAETVVGLGGAIADHRARKRDERYWDSREAEERARYAEESDYE